MNEEIIEKYLDGVLRLSSMIDEGKGDSDEADDLRDDMDVVWFQMAAATQAEARMRTSKALGVRADRKQNNPIDKFDGEYRFLSNFWPAKVMMDQETYPSVEHAYQAAKTTDPSLRKQIALATTPGRAKKMGGGLAFRNDWEEIKLDVMEMLLRQKFAKGSDLAAQLVSTGERELIEGNHWHDVFWGVCKGKGQNHLGRLLMKIRGELAPKE